MTAPNQDDVFRYVLNAVAADPYLFDTVISAATAGTRQAMAKMLKEMSNQQMVIAMALAMNGRPTSQFKTFLENTLAENLAPLSSIPAVQDFLNRTKEGTK